MATIGVFFIGSSFEGYLLWFGGMKMKGAGGKSLRYLFLLFRIGLFVVGFLLAMPESKTDLVGALVFVPLIIVMAHVKWRVQKTTSV
jgi:UPF0716 family protein affecting phage T7 exclusion